MKYFWKRATVALLAAVLVLGLVPLMEPVNIAKAEGDTTQVATFQQLKDAIAAAPETAPGNAVTQNIEITADIQLDGQLTIVAGKNIKLWSKVEYSITAAPNNRLFLVNGKLTLENYVVLTGGRTPDSGNIGITSGTGGGVYVNSSGVFTMNGGRISGNVATTQGGGGVYVNNSGVFTMNGGKISGNVASTQGGGVSVFAGTFTMTGGEISDNTTGRSGGGVCISPAFRAGVFVESTFSMMGGSISGNIVGDGFGGGGVYVDHHTTFTMSGGKINDNLLTSWVSSGCGVYLGGTFNMSGGEISGNTSSAEYAGGGGVCIVGDAQLNDDYIAGTFNMTGGKISSNDGGGVLAGGTFNMSGGEISGNASSAGYAGGGVRVSNSGVFTLNGGEISDNSDSGVAVSGTFNMRDGAIIRENRGNGVFLYGYGAFNMSGGAISDNIGTGVTLGSATYPANNATFIMTGGKITGNTSIESTVPAIMAGGVNIRYGTFTMSGTAIINGNTGRGVYVQGTFNMNGGKINDNTSNGVYVDCTVSQPGIFNMTDGEISNNGDYYDVNVGYSYSGATYVHGGSFTMSGGLIGGRVSTRGTFTMTRGEIAGGVGVGREGVLNLGGQPKINGTVSYSHDANVMSIIDDLQIGTRIIVAKNYVGETVANYVGETVATYTGPNSLTESMAKMFVNTDGSLIGKVSGTDVVFEDVAVDNGELKIVKFNSPNWANYYTSTSEGYFTYNYFTFNHVTSVIVDAEVTSGASWKLYSDSTCSTEISDKTLILNVGNNTSYIQITAASGKTRIVKLIINRSDSSDVNNGQLKRYKIPFHVGLADAETQDIEMSIVWGWDLFSASSSTYDNNLAIAGLAMSEAANNGSSTLYNMLTVLQVTGFLSDGGAHQHFNFLSSDTSGKAPYTIATRYML